MKIYIFPFLIDFVTFLVMLRVTDAAGREMRLSNLQATGLMVAFSLCFLVACLIAAHTLNRQNARPLLVLSIIALLLMGVPLFFSNTFWPTLALFSGFGSAVAFAFNSFQTFMRGEAAPGSLGLSIARFTGAWSTGVACGCLFGGVLKDLGGAPALAIFTTCMCLSVLLMVVTHTPKGLEHASADAAVEEAAPHMPPVDPRYVVVGWMFCLCANFSQRPLTTFIPKFSAEQGNPAWVAGLLLGSYFLAQAVVGYRAQYLRAWLYRPRPIAVIQLLLVTFLGLVWWSPNLWATFLAMIALGGVFGFVYFTAVYYVSNDVRSSRNVGINEAMVGVGNILGMLVSESSMRLLHNQEAYYPATMAVTLLIAAGQIVWIKAFTSAPRPIAVVETA